MIPVGLSQSDLEAADFMAGAMLLVDKPLEWTSFDVVNKLRGVLRHLLGVRKIKVGHSGTLDPSASGLLMICTGKWTKKLHELQGLDKRYSATVMLGGRTASYDAESEVEDISPVPDLGKDDLEKVLEQFRGDIEQVPPMYSAIKVKGQPLYKLARRGETLELDPRPVTIHRLDLESIHLPEISLHVHCSKGTYIRSLAHDLGQELGCGGYLKALRRTAIGKYEISEAWKLDELVEGLQSLQVAS